MTGDWWDCAIARIYDGKGTVVGTGFLVLPSGLLTCAHVVNAAIGHNKDEQTQPKLNTCITIDFPFSDHPQQRFQAQIRVWNPVKNGERGDDIAGLEILGMSRTIVPFLLAYVQLNKPLLIKGFPAYYDREIVGISVQTQAIDRSGNHWILLEKGSFSGIQVDQGFSGAPVFDEVRGVVVGMLVSSDAKTQSSHMIPYCYLKGAVNRLQELFLRSRYVTEAGEKIWLTKAIVADPTDLSDQAWEWLTTWQNERKLDPTQIKVIEQRVRQELNIRKPIPESEEARSDDKVPQYLVKTPVFCTGKFSITLNSSDSNCADQSINVNAPPPFSIKLQNLLVDKKWQEADHETSDLMLWSVKKEGSELSSKDLEKIPRYVLSIINELWWHHSGGRFGFSVQKRIWLNGGGKVNAKTEKYLAVQVGWIVGGRYLKEFNYSTDAPEGHLPLTVFKRTGHTILLQRQDLVPKNSKYYFNGPDNS